MMLEEQDSAQAKRGTKSCTECRRRKIRCIRTSEDAPCRSCEDRGTTCVAQKQVAKSVQSHRLPSRQRITQLESEVAALKRVVRGIQHKIGEQPTEETIASTAQPATSPTVDESDDEDEDESASEVLTHERPSHLQALFQNDWLSVESRQQDERPQEHKTKASTQLLSIARQALQKLIPSREVVTQMTSASNAYIEMIHAVLPQTIAIKTQGELLRSYDDMHGSDVDALDLAIWLLDVALIALQAPAGDDKSPTTLRQSQRLLMFPRAVCVTVERTIFAHDRLVGSVRGLAVGLHYLRLQMSQGNIQKAWIRLRHLITLAELMGLPKAAHAKVSNGTGSEAYEVAQHHKANIWQMLCSADGLYSMILNLPPAIRWQQRFPAQDIVVNGAVQHRAYLSRLGDISSKIQNLDEGRFTDQSIDEHLTSALELDRELSSLASQPPQSWWDYDADYMKPDHIIQNCHNYITLRVHLPFAIQQNVSEEYVYSRLACMDACEALAKRYLTVRQTIPSGFFLSRVVDLQAFTAAIVLLLISYSSLATGRLDTHLTKGKIENLAKRVMHLMGQMAGDSPASDFAKDGSASIRSLIELLQQSEVSNQTQLKLTVPLLGNVSIRRNLQTSPGSTSSLWNPQSSRTTSDPGLWRSSETSIVPQHGQTPYTSTPHFDPSMKMQGHWPANPLSWSVDSTPGDIFSDTIMEDDFDQFSLWPTGFDNFSFATMQ